MMLEKKTSTAGGGKPMARVPNLALSIIFWHSNNLQWSLFLPIQGICYDKNSIFFLNATV